MTLRYDNILSSFGSPVFILHQTSLVDTSFLQRSSFVITHRITIILPSNHPYVPYARIVRITTTLLSSYLLYSFFITLYLHHTSFLQRSSLSSFVLSSFHSSIILRPFFDHSWLFDTIVWSRHKIRLITHDIMFDTKYL